MEKKNLKSLNNGKFCWHFRYINSKDLTETNVNMKTCDESAT